MLVLQVESGYDSVLISAGCEDNLEIVGNFTGSLNGTRPLDSVDVFAISILFVADDWESYDPGFNILIGLVRHKKHLMVIHS